MTKSGNSQPDFVHDAGLFGFLLEDCSFADSQNIPIEIHSVEQEFLEAVVFDRECQVFKRVGARRTGGTTLLCMMALYYHTQCKKVAFIVPNSTVVHLAQEQLKDIMVEGYVHGTGNRTNDCHLYVEGNLQHPHNQNSHPIMFFYGDRKDDVLVALKGWRFDYIFMDTFHNGRFPQVYQAAQMQLNSGGKIIANVTP